MMSPVDPIGFFESHHLEESLVLRFLISDNNILDLVFDYAAPNVSAWFARRREGGADIESQIPPRDFRRLLFKPVSNLRSERGEISGEITAEFGFARLSPETLSPVINRAKVEQSADGGFQADIIVQYWGRYCFQFESLLADRRLGVAVPLTDRRGWAYEDIETHEIFDFYEPFPLSG
jgi:hypothetical protein